MCRQAICKKCQKLTYRGCGMHVEQVLAGVPKSGRCNCAEDAAPEGGLWKRLLGRG